MMKFLKCFYMKIKTTVVWLFGLLMVQSIHAQKIISLNATGSESWDWQEKEYFSPIFNTQIVYNVTHPTLTVYRPDSVPANGTAVIICPGGGFRTLSINSEGIDVAKWLNKKGVTCFVLKYRLAHSLTDDPVKELMAGMGNSKKFDDDNALVVPLAITDAKEAITYVRKHADELGVLTNRIGIIGFSAGGTLAESAVFNYTAENRPDFVAPIYAYVPPDQNTEVPKDAPPMFLAAASDDQLHLVPGSLTLYNKWLAANKSVELHLFARGGHGFGMRKQNLTSDTWIDRFGDWLNQQGLLKGK
jgi:acetyl esterase/lipase